MSTNLRSYRADDSALSNAFGYAATFARRNALAKMLANAEADAEALDSVGWPQGFAEISEHLATAEVAHHTVLTLSGLLAQTERALDSFPADIAAKAADRGYLA